jgi:hypothetical protein
MLNCRDNNMQGESFSDLNVFEMYLAHGGPGFWVRRTTWGTTCARVIRVGAFTAPGPYFGNPSVLMDVYTLGGQLKEGLVPLPVPGTYKTWRCVETPPWAGSTDLRVLDDSAIETALASLDRKRNKAPRKSTTERFWLSVPYERKEEAKQLGARWSPADRSWWLPVDNIEAIDRARVLGLAQSPTVNNVE